jgi:hypothetical protein
MSGWVYEAITAIGNAVASAATLSVGLLTVVAGALFNAHLNRRRDDRLRISEASGVASALHAELEGIKSSLTNNAARLSTIESDFLVPDITASVRVMPASISKLGLLDPETTRALIAAHIVIEQYVGHLIMRGCVAQPISTSRRYISVANSKAKLVIALNEETAKVIQKALDRLASYLR